MDPVAESSAHVSVCVRAHVHLCECVYECVSVHASTACHPQASTCYSEAGVGPSSSKSKEWSPPFKTAKYDSTRPGLTSAHKRKKTFVHTLCVCVCV